VFHVPEDGRITPETHPIMGSEASIGDNGAFAVPSPEPGWALLLICADGTDAEAVGELGEWEHVSVSARALPMPSFYELTTRRPKTRVPTWKEMCFVKALCWDPEDVVVQYHPREADYVNIHPSVLHLWRWKAGAFPTPPKITV
jgi:hypothetical protein